jgi:hypothetical protein
MNGWHLTLAKTTCCCLVKCWFPSETGTRMVDSGQVGNSHSEWMKLPNVYVSNHRFLMILQNCAISYINNSLFFFVDKFTVNSYNIS